MNQVLKTTCVKGPGHVSGFDHRHRCCHVALSLLKAALSFVILFCLSESAGAQLVNGRLVTSLYTWEQFDTIGVSKTYARGMQSLLLDFAEANISLHTHLQGAATLKKTLDEEPDFRSYYLFVKIRNLGSVADLSLGRLPYFAGVGNGILDGGLATVRMAGDEVRLKVYGGARVPDELTLNGWNSLRKSFVLGGQLLTTALENVRLGLSYINRQRERTPYWTLRPDSAFNPVDTYITPDALKEQFLGLDAQYDFSEVSIYGRYDYDLYRDQAQRGQLGLRCAVTERLRLTGDFIHRAPRIAYNSFFGVFASSSLNEYELGGDYLVASSWRAFARGALVDYTDDRSFRYTLGLAHTYASVSYRGANGYAGEQNFISVQGSYPLLDRRIIPSAGITFGSYKLNSSAPKDEAFSVAFGATVRPIAIISIDLQAQVVTNKVVDNDTRFFGKFTYWFAETMSLFE